MEIKVFKSEFTGELFEDEKKYINHLKKHEEEKVLFAKSQELKQMPRLTATSIEDFRQKAFDAISELNVGNPTKLLLLDFDKFHFGDISNTHCRPINGVVNWSKKTDKPTSYKGWYGNITFVLSDTNNNNHDEICNLIRYFPAINKGSGGYRGVEYNGVKGYVLQYSLSLFLSDFPLIEEQYNRYAELKESKAKWGSDINALCDEKNNSDEILILNRSKYAECIEKLKILEKEKTDILNIMSKLCNDNTKIILSENPFKDLDEFNLLSEQLFIKDYSF